jgi:urease gamma subunit
MDLTPREKDKSLVFTAVLLAERRMARGTRTLSFEDHQR